MKKIQTHYDNLQVIENASIEVIYERHPPTCCRKGAFSTVARSDPAVLRELAA